jgi:hypothetical protein
MALVVVCAQKAKSRFVRREKWSRPGAVGMVGQSTCMTHVVHDVKKACWLLACPGGLPDIPGERSCLGGGALDGKIRTDTRLYVPTQTSRFELIREVTKR